MAAFVLVPWYQNIIHHNTVVLLTDSVKGSVNYIAEICPVETVDISAINTCRAV